VRFVLLRDRFEKSAERVGDENLVPQHTKHANEGPDPRVDAARLDPADRRVRHAGYRGELALAHALPAARRPDQSTAIHAASLPGWSPCCVAAPCRCGRRCGHGPDHVEPPGWDGTFRDLVTCSQ